MIHKLQAHLVELLRAGLTGAIVAPATHIMEGLPPGAVKPFIAVYGGEMTIGNQATDFGSSQPRPMEISELFPINVAKPQGPYPLSKSPLEGTGLVKLVIDMGGLNERRRVIVEKKDFLVDYPNQKLNILVPLVGVSHIQITYSFAGIFFLQDFQHDFFIEVIAVDTTTLEQLSSLVTAIVFTHHDDLIEGFNHTDRTVYSVNQYLSEHWIGRLAWLDSHSAINGGDYSFKMRFSVNGQIKHVRSDVGGFGIIEKIHSPGVTATDGVNIDPELG